MSRTIRVGARRSPLAVAQARWVASQLEAAGHPCELVGIDTLGDVDRRRLTEIGGTGVFATAVRDHLRAGDIDVAVHSLKDLPVEPAPGLVVAAIPEREDVRDVLVGRGVDEWVDGTVVGTGSPRRAVQLQALAAARGVRIEVVPVRGNVDTRLGLVSSGEVDATVLAAAGLRRLGHLAADVEDVTTIAGLRAELLGLDRMLPAAGQGALAVECSDQAVSEVLASLADVDHADSRAEVLAERTFLSVLEAGCLAPVGAVARVVGTDLTLRVVAGRESANTGNSAGNQGLVVTDELTAPLHQAGQVGAELARRVLGTLERNG